MTMVVLVCLLVTLPSNIRMGGGNSSQQLRLIMMSESPQKLGRSEWNEYMNKVKARDKDAFAFVFRFYAPKLKQFAYKHVGNEQVAMEMVQETMATVWQKAHLYDGTKSALSTWIYTIIRNLCFDLLRKQKGKDLHIHSDDI